MPKLAVILGVTSRQGRSIAETYSADPEWIVRGFCRDPSSSAACSISTLGIEVVKGDFNEPSTILSAIRGANFVFASTDFWSIYRDPASRSQVAAGETLNEYAFEKEVEQGTNIVDAVATIVHRGLEMFILSVLADVKGISEGKYTWVYHYDSRAAVEEYIKDKIPELAEKTSYYVPGGFTENLFSVWKPVKGEEGVYVLRLPGKGETKIPIIDVADTGKAVQSIHRNGPGKKVLVYGDMLTVRELLSLWGNVNKVQTRYEQISLEGYAKLLPPGLGIELGEMMLYIDEFGYVGDGQGYIDWKELDEGLKTTGVENWIRKMDWLSVIR